MTSKYELASEAIRIQEDAIKALAKKKILAFTTHTKEDYQINWHHRVIAKALDKVVNGEILNLIVQCPPRVGKSELISRRLPAFAFGKNPDEQIIATSHTADLAQSFNRDCQRIIDTPLYKEIFPNTTLSGEMIRSTKAGSWLRNSDIFEIVGHKGYYKSAGVGGAITGRGATLGLIDDPIKDFAMADSKRQREVVWDWYTSTFLTRLEKNARQIIVMTRWHHDDLVGRILKQQDHGFTVIDLPMVMDTEPTSYDKRPVTQVLWPDKFSKERSDTIKQRVGTRVWNSLYQQRPTQIEGGIIKRDWIKFYKTLPARVNSRSQSWDLTFKDGSNSDYVAGQVWAKCDAEHYLLDQVRDRMDFTSTIRAIKSMTSKHPLAMSKLIEDTANGPAVINSLKKEIPGIIPIHPRGSKSERLSAISPLFEAGNVYFPDPSIAPWVHDLIEELITFPSGAHDDQVDALSQYLNRYGGQNGYSLSKSSQL